MGIEFTDKSDKSREDKEIIEAKMAMKSAMVTSALQIPPSLAIYGPTIIEALDELLMIRAFLKKIKEGN